MAPTNFAANVGSIGKRLRKTTSAIFGISRGSSTATETISSAVPPVPYRAHPTTDTPPHPVPSQPAEPDTPLLPSGQHGEGIVVIPGSERRRLYSSGQTHYIPDTPGDGQVDSPAGTAPSLITTSPTSSPPFDQTPGELQPITPATTQLELGQAGQMGSRSIEATLAGSDLPFRSRSRLPMSLSNRSGQARAAPASDFHPAGNASNSSQADDSVPNRRSHRYSHSPSRRMGYVGPDLHREDVSGFNSSTYRPPSSSSYSTGLMSQIERSAYPVERNESHRRSDQVADQDREVPNFTLNSPSGAEHTFPISPEGRILNTPTQMPTFTNPFNGARIPPDLERYNEEERREITRADSFYSPYSDIGGTPHMRVKGAKASEVQGIRPKPPPQCPTPPKTDSDPYMPEGKPGWRNPETPDTPHSGGDDTSLIIRASQAIRNRLRRPSTAQTSHSAWSRRTRPSTAGTTKSHKQEATDQSESSFGHSPSMWQRSSPRDDLYPPYSFPAGLGPKMSLINAEAGREAEQIHRMEAVDSELPYTSGRDTEEAALPPTGTEQPRKNSLNVSYVERYPRRVPSYVPGSPTQSQASSPPEGMDAESMPDQTPESGDVDPITEVEKSEEHSALKPRRVSYYDLEHERHDRASGQDNADLAPLSDEAHKADDERGDIPHRLESRVNDSLTSATRGLAISSDGSAAQAGRQRIPSPLQMPSQGYHLPSPPRPSTDLPPPVDDIPPRLLRFAADTAEIPDRNLLGPDGFDSRRLRSPPPPPPEFMLYRDEHPELPPDSPPRETYIERDAPHITRHMDDTPIDFSCAYPQYGRSYTGSLSATRRFLGNSLLGSRQASPLGIENIPGPHRPTPGQLQGSAGPSRQASGGELAQGELAPGIPISPYQNRHLGIAPALPLGYTAPRPFVHQGARGGDLSGRSSRASRQTPSPALTSIPGPAPNVVLIGRPLPASASISTHTRSTVSSPSPTRQPDVPRGWRRFIGGRSRSRQEVSPPQENAYDQEITRPRQRLVARDSAIEIPSRRGSHLVSPLSFYPEDELDDDDYEDPSTLPPARVTSTANTNSVDVNSQTRGQTGQAAQPYPPTAVTIPLQRALGSPFVNQSERFDGEGDDQAGPSTSTSASASIGQKAHQDRHGKQQESDRAELVEGEVEIEEERRYDPYGYGDGTKWNGEDEGLEEYTYHVHSHNERDDKPKLSTSTSRKSTRDRRR